MNNRGGLPPNKYLTDAQLEALRAVLPDDTSRRSATDRLIIEILVDSGLRAQELVNLDIADLPQTHQKDVIYVRDGKGKVSRAVYIPERLIVALRAYTDAYGLTDGPLLRNCYGKRIHYRTVYEKIRRLGRKAGLELHPHALRHTYLSRLYNVEHDLRFVQDQAGHKSPTTTAIYAKTNNEARKRQVEKL